MSIDLGKRRKHFIAAIPNMIKQYTAWVNSRSDISPTMKQRMIERYKLGLKIYVTRISSHNKAKSKE